MNDGWNNVPDALYAAYTSGVADERRRAKIAAGLDGLYGLRQGPVSTPNAGGKCVTDGETSPDADFKESRLWKSLNRDPQGTHTLNSTKTVAVSNDTYWLPIDADTPRSAKLQLLSIGGVAQYGSLGSDTSFYTHWCPLPKKAKP